MSPADAASLNRCCTQQVTVSSRPPSPTRHELTRHSPNSENTPPPRPVSVHRFLITVGRVCGRREKENRAGTSADVPPPSQEAGRHTSRGKAFNLSMAAVRILGSIVSLRTMKR